MYELNGIIYGGKPSEGIQVERVKVLNDMIMLVTFTTGETRLFDATILTGEVFKPLKNEEIFRSASVEHGVVAWNDGEIDCSPEFMYDNSYEYTMVS